MNYIPLILPVLVIGVSLSPVARAEPDQQPSRCKSVIARVVSRGDQNFRAGDLLCPDDWVRPVQGQHPKLVCRRAKKALSGQTGRVRDLCARQPRSSFAGEGASDILILNPRGNSVNPNLIHPFGSVLMQRRPDLSWKPTRGASYYLVRIDGYAFKHEQIVSGTQLSYPQAWPALEYGNVYQIDIFAYRGDRIVSTDRVTVNLLFEEEVAVIQDYVAAIQRLSLPPSKVALDLDAVYMSKNLLNQSIQMLESLREKGQSNQQLNRLLADRYAQAGWPDLAKLIAKEPQPRTKIKFPQK